MPRTLLQWTCSRDRSPLQGDEQRLQCPDCGRGYPVVEGVVDFRRGSERGAYSSASPALDRLLELVATIGIDSAAAEWCRRAGCSQEYSATDLRSFVGAPGSGRILEIGAGFGDDTVEIARRGAEVVSLVPTLRNARIVRRRLEQASQLRVSLAVLRDLSRIPLSSDSVDTIIVEEVGSGAFGLRPHGLSQAVAEWKRVLKPQGCLVLAQSNRLYGFPPIAALRARWVRGGGVDAAETLNRRVKRLAGGDEAQPLGLRATLRCLEAQGFARPRLYAPLPDAGSVEILVPIEDRGVARYCFGQLLRQNAWFKRLAIGGVHALSRFNLLRALVPHYYVLCSASTDARDGA